MDYGAHSGPGSNNTSTTQVDLTLEGKDQKETNKLQVNMNFVNIFNSNFDKRNADATSDIENSGALSAGMSHCVSK